MFSLPIYLAGLAAVCAAGFVTWILSCYLNNVSIVDSLWSLMFVLLACCYARGFAALEPRTLLVLVLVTAWALRLSVYITWRNHGAGEDRRQRQDQHQRQKAQHQGQDRPARPGRVLGRMAGVGKAHE